MIFIMVVLSSSYISGLLESSSEMRPLMTKELQVSLGWMRAEMRKSLLFGSGLEVFAFLVIVSKGMARPETL